MEWKTVSDCNGYEVSDSGTVRATKTGKNRKLLISATGYAVVRFANKNWPVHRLVAKAFVPNPENKPQVNHKDGNKANNSADNLEWVTAAENMRHSYEVLGNIGPRKRVGKYSLEGALLEVYGSVADAIKGTSYDYSTVASQAAGKRGYRKAYGFQWAYYSEDSGDCLPTHENKRIRSVVGRREDDSVEYSSVTEAAKSLNITPSAVFAALSGKNKTAGGFRWEYK